MLWVLRDHVGLTGTKFGCGMALCGACTVHLDGAAGALVPDAVSAAAGKKITTIEGVGATRPARRCRTPGSKIGVPQCGYCQSGQIMSATALLQQNPKPSDADIDERDGRQHLPLRHLHPHPHRDQVRGRHGRCMMNTAAIALHSRRPTRAPEQRPAPAGAAS